MNNFIKEQF